jgi:hypothetical protein
MIIEQLLQSCTKVCGGPYVKYKMGAYIYDLLINFLKCKSHWCLLYHTDFHRYPCRSTILRLNNLSFLIFLLMELFPNSRTQKYN